MLYISGFMAWVIAFAILSPHLPGKLTMAAVFFLWLGLVQWELAMREYWKGKE